MNANIKQLFCYDRDPNWTQLWNSYLTEDVKMVELNNLDEMVCYSSFEEPALLLLREGGLSSGEIKVLSRLVLFFRELRVLAFGNFENLKWCVDLLKMERTNMAPSPSRKEDFLKQVEENFMLAGLGQEPLPVNLPHLLQHVVDRCVKTAAPLEEACHTFEQVYQDYMVKACHNNMQKAADHLRMNREDLAKNLSVLKGGKGVILDETPGTSQEKKSHYPRCG